MIAAKPTEHLTGLTLEGTFTDFYEIVESIYRMTGLDFEEDKTDPLYSVKERLLGVCYDIRHAFMGDREIYLRPNGVHDEMMKWHSMIMPKNEVVFSVNLLFPEAVFVALAMEQLCVFEHRSYGVSQEGLNGEELPPLGLALYLRDRAILDMFSAVVMEALSAVIGNAELEKIYRLIETPFCSFINYATMYIDKCNIEYLKTPVDKRKDKLKNIAKRIVKQPDGYKSLKRDLEYNAKLLHCTIHDLADDRIQYPEEIVW